MDRMRGMAKLPVKFLLLLCFLFGPSARAQPGTGFPFPWAVLPVAPVTTGGTNPWNSISCSSASVGSDAGGQYASLSITAATSNVGCGGQLNPGNPNWPQITADQMPYSVTYRLFMRTVAGTVAGGDEVKSSQVAVHTFLRGQSSGRVAPQTIADVNWQEVPDSAFENRNTVPLATNSVWYNITAERYSPQSMRFFIDGIPAATTWYNSSYNLGDPFFPPYWGLNVLKVGSVYELRVGQVILWSPVPRVQCAEASSSCTASRWLRPGCIAAFATDRWNIPTPTCNINDIAEGCINITSTSTGTQIRLCPQGGSPIGIAADLADLQFVFDDWSTSFSGVGVSELEVRTSAAVNNTRGTQQSRSPSASGQLALADFPGLQTAYTAGNELRLEFWMNTIQSSNKTLLNGTMGYARRSVAFSFLEPTISTTGAVSISQANEVTTQFSSSQSGFILQPSIRYSVATSFTGSCVPGSSSTPAGNFSFITQSITLGSGWSSISGISHTFNLTLLLESYLPLQSSACVVADIAFAGATKRFVVYRVYPSLSISARSSRWMSRTTTSFDVIGAGFHSDAVGKRAAPLAVDLFVTNSTATNAPVSASVALLSETSLRVTFADFPPPAGDYSVQIQSLGQTFTLPNYLRIVVDPTLNSNSSFFNQILGARLEIRGSNFATENVNLNTLALTTSSSDSPPDMIVISVSSTLFVCEIVSFGTNTGPVLLRAQLVTYGVATSNVVTVASMSAPIILQPPAETPAATPQVAPVEPAATPKSAPSASPVSAGNPEAQPSAQPISVPTASPVAIPIATTTPTSNNNINGGAPTNSNNDGTVIGLAVGLTLGILIVILIVVLAIFFRKRRHNQPKKAKPTDVEMDSPYGPTPTPETHKRDTLSSDLEKWMIPFNELTLVKEVGRGSFGIVWRGKWRDQRVAIKESKLADPLKRREFFAEAQLMLNLRPHKNVVQVLGISYVPDTDTYYIVMDFMSSSLDKLVYAEDRNISELEMLKLARGIASGVGHINKEQIVHRDLAVRNILLSKESSTPKISDFGMSRAIAGGNGSAETNTAIGPIAWMSPENINRQYSTKSDVWAFGCVLYEISTGRAPHYDQPDKLTLALEIREGKHPKIPKDAPEEFVYLMEKCWQMDPDARPDFSEIIRYLKKKIRARKGSESSGSSQSDNE